MVQYIDWNNHQSSNERLPNPVQYTYFKSACYKEETELRVSLSALGLGHFAIDDGKLLEFDIALQVEFDFRVAIQTGGI